MNRQIFRFLTAAGLSLTIALSAVTVSASPARADSDDAARLIGGLIALYAIGQALQSSAEAHPPRHTQPRRNLRVAPARCFIEGRDRNGYFRGYRARCMERHVARPRLLPDECLRRVRTENGPRQIYGGRCLTHNGWVREARGRR